MDNRFVVVVYGEYETRCAIKCRLLGPIAVIGPCTIAEKMAERLNNATLSVQLAELHEHGPVAGIRKLVFEWIEEERANG